MTTCCARFSFAWASILFLAVTLLDYLPLKKEQSRWYNTTKYGDGHEKKNQFLENTRFKTLMINFPLDEREIKVGEHTFVGRFDDQVFALAKIFQRRSLFRRKVGKLGVTIEIKLIDVMTAFFDEKNLKRRTGPLGESTLIFEAEATVSAPLLLPERNSINL